MTPLEDKAQVSDLGANNVSDRFGKASIFPSRVSHARLFPKAHRFAYSYLLIGIPVTPEGVNGNVLTADVKERGWLSVEGEEHLERGAKTLNEKIDDYLVSIGHSRAEFPHVYLVCAPRVFGYQFNPASFWYLYDTNKVLKAMLVEVNNTFGERRLYWCPRTQPHSEEGNDGPPADKHHEAGLQFGWQKDFHVSPFNSRKGTYALSSMDPFADGREPNHLIDNRITLLSNHGRAKLVARARSSDEPLDPEFMSRSDTIKILTLWWWVGFATFPRIAAQAARLYFTHKLHVWFRPEVKATSISQAPTSDERTLEYFFRLYLIDLTRRLPPIVSLRYTAPFEPSFSVKDIAPSSAQTLAPAKPLRELHMSVSSPAFYSRMIYYDSVRTALLREGIYCRDENRTVHVTHPGKFEDVLPETQDKLGGTRSLLRWLLVGLRSKPPPASYPEPDSMPAEDTLGSTPKVSELDNFVLTKCSTTDQRTYMKTVVRMFVLKRVADRLGLLLILIISSGLGVWITRTCRTQTHQINSQYR